MPMPGRTYPVDGGGTKSSAERPVPGRCDVEPTAVTVLFVTWRALFGDETPGGVGDGVLGPFTATEAVCFGARGGRPAVPEPLDAPAARPTRGTAAFVPRDSRRARPSALALLEAAFLVPPLPLRAALEIRHDAKKEC